MTHSSVQQHCIDNATSTLANYCNMGLEIHIRFLEQFFGRYTCASDEF